MIVMREIEVQPNPLTRNILMMIVMARRAGNVCLAPLISDDQLNEPITAQIIVHGRKTHRLNGKTPKIHTVSM